MERSSERYDIGIIGSGFAGSTLGAVLARNGLRVVIIEAGTHPKFAIGESMILETSESLRAIAELYDVPEIAYLSSENYFSFIGTSHGVKRHFSYLYHSPGESQDLTKALQAVIPKQPHGHELHLYRQDTDSFLTTVAIQYGATVLQNTRVGAVHIGNAGVEIVTDQDRSFQVEYVVDAGGFRSPLAQQFDLRDRELRTHSRTIFTHMVDVPCYHKVNASKREYGLPFLVSEGTLHHIFRGGWLWVIPFDNHPHATNPLCSVGLMLDPRVYPADSSLSPEEEFYSFIERFPGIRNQFRGAKAVRNWTRTGRIQYSSKKIVGDRYCLLGHAAGFIDPLYSKGLYATSMSVSLLAHLLLNAQETGDYSAAQFQRLEDVTLAFLQSNDRLIVNSYKSFTNYKLWSVYCVLWLLGAYTELVKLSSARVQAQSRDEYYESISGLKLVGGGYGEFDLLADRIDTIIERVNADDEAAVDEAVAEIQGLFAPVDWMPQPFHDVLHGKNHLPVNKLRLGLLRRETGFLGSGEYRDHFFGDGSAISLLQKFLFEKAKYSTASLNWRRRRR